MGSGAYGGPCGAAVGEDHKGEASSHGRCKERGRAARRQLDRSSAWFNGALVVARAVAMAAHRAHRETHTYPPNRALPIDLGTFPIGNYLGQPPSQGAACLRLLREWMGASPERAAMAPGEPREEMNWRPDATNQGARVHTGHVAAPDPRRTIRLSPFRTSSSSRWPRAEYNPCLAGRWDPRRNFHIDRVKG